MSDGSVWIVWVSGDVWVWSMMGSCEWHYLITDMSMCEDCVLWTEMNMVWTVMPAFGHAWLRELMLWYMRVCSDVYLWVIWSQMYVCMYVRMYVSMYVCMGVMLKCPWWVSCMESYVTPMTVICGDIWMVGWCISVGDGITNMYIWEVMLKCPLWVLCAESYVNLLTPPPNTHQWPATTLSFCLGAHKYKYRWPQCPYRVLLIYYLVPNP